MTLYRITLGHVIREERKDRGMKLRDFTGVSIAHLSEIERGRKEPSSEVLGVIADTMRMPLWEIVSKVSKEMEREACASKLYAVA